MAEMPTLLTCGICGEKSLRPHGAVGCIEALRARAGKAEGDVVFWRQRYDAAVKMSGDIESDLAAARRETALYRGVIDNLLSTMEMQEKRESGAFHITGEVMWGIWSDAKSQARAALAAPAAGEEGTT